MVDYILTLSRSSSHKMGILQSSTPTHFAKYQARQARQNRYLQTRMDHFSQEWAIILRHFSFMANKNSHLMFKLPIILARHKLSSNTNLVQKQNLG